MSVAPLARARAFQSASRLILAINLALAATACTTTPDEPSSDDPALDGSAGQPGFGTSDAAGGPHGDDTNSDTAGAQDTDGPGPQDAAGPSDSGSPSDPGPRQPGDDDPCATQADGAWCWQGSLLTCLGGTTTSTTACQGGCLAPVGGLPHACAGDPCAGKTDGEYCVEGALVACAGGQVTATTPCPAGCVEGPSQGCLSGPEGDALCGDVGDGLVCDGELLVNCAGGISSIVVECELGCVPSPPGLPDACAEPPPVAGFCTEEPDGQHCEGSALVQCAGGAIVKQTACLEGCVSTGAGGEDKCLEPPPSGDCAGKSDGDWCAGDAVVTCVGETVVATVPCAVGCLSMPAGVPDQCVEDDASFCTPVPAEVSPSPPTTSCAYMDWERSPDGFYLVSQFGTTSDATTLGNKTSCGYLQDQYNGAGCVYDQQTAGCLAGAHAIPWTQGHVDWDQADVLDAVASVPAGGDVPFPEYFYVAGAQRFGCGALLRVSHPDTGRCVVVYAEDGGPGATYEGAAFGGRRILDSSPAVIAALEVSQKGWLSSDLLYVEWGLAGDVPGQACQPCQSSAATQANATGLTPWRLEHMVPACGSGAASGATCPSGDGLYCGGSVNADGDTLYDCKGGELTVVEICGVACVTNPPGTPDGCAEAGGSCPSGDGAYCGGTVEADPGTLYQCVGGQLSVLEVCEAGCLQMPPGTPDKCAESGPATTCPSGNGAYCGGAVGADPDTLYQCTNGDLSVLEACTDGCEQQAAGTPDKCATPPSGGSCPSGDGAYCGGSLGLDSDTLYWCAGGNTSVLESCDQGCQINAPGVPDSCAGGSGALSMCNPFSPPQSVTCGFGCYSGHYGSDYAVGNGTPIYSPIAGVVIDKVDSVPGQTCTPDFGNYVKIRQGAYDVFLAHMSANILVDDDDVISQGDPIGFVSNTGYTLTLKNGEWVCQQGGGYHLHLEVRKNGVAFDPIGSSDVAWSSECSGGGVIDPPTGFCADKVNGLWCNGSSLVNCQGGSEASSTPCPNGCEQMPFGTPDQCSDEDPGGTCPSGNGLYCGGSVGLDANTLYNCSNGSYSTAEVCSEGCEVMPPGTEDKCKDAPQPTCPSGNGLYCGGPVGLDSSTLYNCSNGNYSFYAWCGSGCYVAPPGQADSCNAGSCPFGNGAYCGQTGGLDSDKLYNCSNGTWTVIQNCGTTCYVAPPGQPDVCP